ncbi:hypothetical protein GOARA_048_00030 [Gordonia araii NBRC 100433]|uniref:Uncharacterized protein n=1 Tax=Gordonia araii NBRC 100433 TaxID=1073574 RepID=G7H1S6_9ACTN|nr:hypothetical protein [Gordonia araii]NNG97136.1 hypothetical protein [Gordonia araii NBRC 100433]GAB09801.1 hypothetical protein GOARA_048_00030 [Gordonia araii NBRC 100433]
MKISSKRAITISAVVTAAAAGTICAAPESAARLANGGYRISTTQFGVVYNSYARVDGNRFIHLGAFGTRYLTVHHTRSGGYVDDLGGRFIYDRRPGGVYSGPVFLGPFVVGHSTMRPAR